MDPMLVVVDARVEELEQEVGRLGGRLSLLEKSFAETAPRAAAAVKIEPRRPFYSKPPLTAKPQPAPALPVAPPVQAAPPPMRVAEPKVVAPPKPRVSLEERLGQNWLNKLGIVTLVTGLALLLGYQARTLGPLGKSMLGVLLSLAILVTGLVLERRERYRVFARAAIGGGWALLYFVAFALFHVPAMQVLQSQTADFALMLAVAAGMVLHSLRYRSQVVTSLAFLHAFFTKDMPFVVLNAYAALNASINWYFLSTRTA